jgi:hypothetical protein
MLAQATERTEGNATLPSTFARVDGCLADKERLLGILQRAGFED